MSSLQADPKVVEFLGLLCKKTKLKQAFDDERQRKDLLIKEMAEELEPFKPALRKAMDFQVKQGRTKIKALDKRGQMKQIETEEASKTSGLSKEDHVAVGRAFDKLEEIKRRMKEAQVAILDDEGNPVLDKDGNPKTRALFEGWGEDKENGRLKNNDMGLEFYDPLVREGLMPENLVPKDVSLTQQLLDETMIYYEEGVKADHEAMQQKVKEGAYHKQKGFTMDSILARVTEAKDWAGEYLATPVAAIKTISYSTTAANLDLSIASQAFEALEKTNLLHDLLNPIQEGLTAFKEQLTAAAQNVSDHVANVLQTAGNHIKEGLGTKIAAEFQSKLAPTALFAGGSNQPPTVEQFNEHVKTTSESIRSAFAKHGMGDVGDGVAKAYLATHEKYLPNIDPTQLGDPATAKQSIDDYIKKSATALSKFVPDLLTIISPSIAMHSANKAVSAQDTALAELQQQAKIETLDPEQAARIENAAGVLVMALADSLARIIGQIDGDAGQTVAGAYRTATNGARIAAYLTQVPPKAKEAVELLADGFVQALKTCDPNPQSPVFQKLGTDMANIFLKLADPDKLQKDIEANQLGNLFKPLHEAGEKAVARAVGVKLPGGEDDQGTGPEDAQNTNTIKALFKQDRIKAAMRRKIDEKQEQEALVRLDEARQEAEDYRRKLVQVDKMGESMAEERTIEHLIQDLQKKRLILSIVFAVANAGTDAIKAFIGPMAAAALAVKFIAEVIAAAERLDWYLTWREEHAAAVSASSALYAAMQNFEKNQSEQLTHHTLQATFIFVQIAGSVVASSGLATHIGQAIQATGAALQSIESLCQKEYDKKALEAAWRLTLQARNNPNNRRLGLMAQKQNPTLAKYAIAWAATKNHDVLAKKAMDACGLNALTLSNKGTNVHKVVNYLQTLFNEDRVVVSNKALNTANIGKVETITVDWQPPALDLTLKSWVIAKRRGETKARPTVKEQNTSGIDSLFKKIAAHEQKLQAFKPPARPDADLVEAYLDDVTALIGELQAYRPRRVTDFLEHLEMLEVAKQFVQLAKTREADLIMLVAELQGATAPDDSGDEDADT